MDLEHHACNCWVAAPSCARSRPPPNCSPPSTESPPTSGAARASPNWAATRSPRSAGTCCTPAGNCAVRGSPRSSRSVRRGRSLPRRTTCARSPSRSVRRCLRIGGMSFWVRTVSAARTTARRCVGTSRSTASTWSSRPWPRWPPTVWSRRARSRTRSPATTLTRTSSTRPAPDSAHRSARTFSTGRRGSSMSTATAGATEVKVPDIGDFSAVPIVEVLVATGDKVNAEDPLLTLESDKATLDVPAPSAGTVGEVLVKVGDEVSEGTPILLFTSGDGASTTPPSLVEQQEPAPGPAQAKPVAEAVGAPLAAPPAVSAQDGGQAPAGAHAGPSVRRMARELGIDLSKIDASGAKGRITKDDLLSFLKGPATPAPAAAPAAAQGSGIPEIPAQDFSK